MSVFRPSARVTDPGGREWEIYAYRLVLPCRSSPDPLSGGFGYGGYGGFGAPFCLDVFAAMSLYA